MHVWFGFPIQYDFSVGHGACLFRRTRMMPNPSTSTPLQRSGRAPFEKFKEINGSMEARAGWAAGCDRGSQTTTPYRYKRVQNETDPDMTCTS